MRHRLRRAAALIALTAACAAGAAPVEVPDPGDWAQLSPAEQAERRAAPVSYTHLTLPTTTDV